VRPAGAGLRHQPGRSGLIPNKGEWAGIDTEPIRALGNYGQLFDRNLGDGSPLKIRRGLNNLWNKGGILYAPPVR
jgi:general L-amino acid transport system substrate-binding protein